MEIIKLVNSALATNGFDGLVVPGVCGCLIDDLSPADCLAHSCQAGYKHTHSQRPSDWIVSLHKDAQTDAEIERCLAECG